MGNSHVGFKSNLNLIQSNYMNWIIEAIFQASERVDYLFLKVYLKKNDNNNWNKSAKNVKSPKTR